MNARGIRRCALLVATALALGAASPAIAAQDATSDDISAYVSESGVDLRLAQARYRAQSDFDAIVELARTSNPDNFAWASWSTELSVQPSIYFVDQPTQEFLGLVADLPVRIEINTGASVSEHELSEAARRLTAALESAPDRSTALVLQEFAGPSARIRILATPIDSTSRASLGDTLEIAKHRNPGIDFELTFADLQASDATVTGGGDIGSDICTAAFPVTSGTAKGITTAAHCSDWTSLYQGNAITFRAATLPAQGDAQWSQFTGAVTLSNQIRISTTPTYRAITSTANPSLSDLVCYFGRTSGQHCGTVANANVSLVINGVTFGNLFLTNLATIAGGDSGGPWFFGQTGYGVTKGFITVKYVDGTTHTYAMASRIEVLQSLGLTVRTAP